MLDIITRSYTEYSIIGADELDDELEESGKSAEDAGGKFEKFGGILKGIGATMGAVVIAAGAAAIKLGKEVYKNLGVSQRQHLATANKMGALFQGSGIAMNAQNVEIYTLAKGLDIACKQETIRLFLVRPRKRIDKRRQYIIEIQIDIILICG